MTQQAPCTQWPFSAFSILIFCKSLGFWLGNSKARRATFLVFRSFFTFCFVYAGWMLETWNLKWNGTWNNIDVSDLTFYIDTSIYRTRECAISVWLSMVRFQFGYFELLWFGLTGSPRLGFSFFSFVSFHFSVSHSTSLLVLDSRIHRKSFLLKSVSILELVFWIGDFVNPRNRTLALHLPSNHHFLSVKKTRILKSSFLNSELKFYKLLVGVKSLWKEISYFL